MYFYEVWVCSNRYRGNYPLTYSYNLPLKKGQLVSVPLKKDVVVGVITSTIKAPNIKTKKLSPLSLPLLPKETLKLMQWLKTYYPSPIGVIAKQFIPPGLGLLQNNTHSAQLGSVHRANTLPILTVEQQNALKILKKPDTYLLHGRTGSGKTRIYAELVKQQIKNGRSAIILTPEISLTSQLEEEIGKATNALIIIMHSTLSPIQRAERWKLILENKQPMIVIGPRSVIFSPLENIGLIVIDEEHEPAYKQEQAPYYVTARVAAKLRTIHSSILVLASATPLVSDYWLAENRQKPIIRLNELATINQKIMKLKTILVDCHDRSLFPRSNYFSHPLINETEKALARGEQVLFYLNRRGTARLIVCGNCDWQAKCLHCDLPLTYHGDTHTLLCHVCGYKTVAPVDCPKCSQPQVKYLSIGTKAVVDEAKRLFPHSRILRFDSDSTKANRLENHYQEIKNGEVDIIIGTQLLAKGLDLPKLSVVGILLADTSLQLPDYNVNERTYQLLSQVIGRVGRGHRDGVAIIQTYRPESDAIKSAINNNWQEFYTREINERQQYIYPPFSHILKLTLERSSISSVEKATKKLISNLPNNIKIEGPAPAFHEKKGNKYRWQIVIKSNERSKLLNIISQLPNNCTWDIDPSDLL